MILACCMQNRNAVCRCFQNTNLKRKCLQIANCKNVIKANNWKRPSQSILTMIIIKRGYMQNYAKTVLNPHLSALIWKQRPLSSFVVHRFTFLCFMLFLIAYMINLASCIIRHYVEMKGEKKNLQQSPKPFWLNITAHSNNGMCAMSLGQYTPFPASLIISPFKCKHLCIGNQNAQRDCVQ